MKRLNRCDYFVITYALYQMQGILYPVGIINQLLQFLLISWAFSIAGKYLIWQNCNTPILKSTCVLLWMYIIYGIIYILFPLEYLAFQPVSYSYLQNSLNSLLPIFAFYQFTKNGYLKEDKFKYYIIIFLSLCIMHFFLAQRNLLESALERGSKAKEFTINVGYEFLGVLPIIPLLKKKIYQYLYLAITMAFIFIAFKRGAILIGTLSVIYYLYFDIVKSSSATKKTIMLIGAGIFLSAGFIYAQHLYNESGYFRLRVEQTQSGNTSQRDVLYRDILNSYCNPDLTISYIVGSGANSTIKAAGNFAHQDWLETLHNNGIIGLIILMVFYVSIFKTYKSLKRKKLNKQFQCSFMMLFIICFLKTMFSMSIQNMELSISMLLGFYSCIVYKSNYGYLRNK